MKKHNENALLQRKQSSAFFGGQKSGNSFIGGNASTSQFFSARPMQKKQSAQMKAGAESQQTEGSTGTSQKLPGDFQAKMENSFQTDFSNVNVFPNSQKASNAGALAYTQGNDIHFSPGQFNLGSNKGQELAAHEMTHVVQQQSGRVKATNEVNGMPLNDNAGLEKEADDMGAKAVKGEAVQMQGAGGSSGSNSIQRKGFVLQRKTGIRGTVGAGGKNSYHDVVTVQRLLKAVGYNLLAVDGVVGPITIGAIKEYQQSVFGWMDGLVEPGQQTWQKLMKESGGSKQKSSEAETPQQESGSKDGDAKENTGGTQTQENTGGTQTQGGNSSSINGSVGVNAINNPEDVLKVQKIINSNGYNIAEDGEIGQETIGAIEDFQATRFGWRNPDGVVEPGGKTWNGMTAKLPAAYENQSIGGNAKEGTYNIIYASKVSSAFAKKVIAISQYLGVDHNNLMAAMAFESGGTFSPSIRNAAGSGATGLIQFMPFTARNLGTTTSELARMSAVEQLDWVQKYFEPYKGRLRNLSDVYMAILWPAAVGKSEDYVLFRQGNITYTQNAGLDTNRNGLVTKKEAAGKVYGRLQTGQNDVGQVQIGAKKKQEEQGGNTQQGNDSQTQQGNDSQNSDNSRKDGDEKENGGNEQAPTNNNGVNSIAESVGAKGVNNPEDVLKLQKLINTNGYKITEDGEIGPETIGAIDDFQMTRFGWRNPDGTVSPGGKTWNGMVDKLPAVHEKPKAIEGKPPWIQIAEGELGVKENTSRSRHNPRVVEYHSTTGGWKDDETPWCASFVNWVMKRSGYGGNNSAWALDWARYGRKISRPAYGAIVVFDGHVGFLVGKSGSRIRVLGGNQNNEVNISNYGTSRVVAYVVPSSYQVPADAYTLREGSGINSSINNTR